MTELSYFQTLNALKINLFFSGWCFLQPQDPKNCSRAILNKSWKTGEETFIFWSNRTWNWRWICVCMERKVYGFIVPFDRITWSPQVEKVLYDWRSGVAINISESLKDTVFMGLSDPYPLLFFMTNFIFIVIFCDWVRKLLLLAICWNQDYEDKNLVDIIVDNWII